MSKVNIDDFMDIDVIRDLIEGLCKVLKEAGAKAEILEVSNSRSKHPEVLGGRSSKLDAYNVYSPYEAPQFLGCIKVQGMNFDQLQVWQKQIFGHPSLFRGVRWRDIHFVIPRPKGERRLRGEKIDDALKVELRYDTKGFIKKKLVDVKWQGGYLANLLNDKDVRDPLFNVKKEQYEHKGGISEANDLRIANDEGYDCVRIYLPMTDNESCANPMVVAKTAEHLKICNKIAGCIRNILSSKDL